MQIDTVVFYQITDPKLFTYGVERPLSAIENLTYISFNNNDDNSSVFDDICLIKDQVLWTGNFTVPNYLLTGDKDIPSKIKTRQLMYPPRYGDYFDKAILY